MGHPIIFKTKFVNLSDGRIMHLSLQGCNNDTGGVTMTIGRRTFILKQSLWCGLNISNVTANLIKSLEHLS